MQPLVILCHPFERSFCHAIARALVEGFSGTAGAVPEGPTAEPRSGPRFHDLYAESPDPVLTGAEIARRFSLDEQIQAYSDELVASDTIAVVHPDWWCAPPALLKGWIERVLRPGIAYDWEGEEFEEKHHVPLLTGRRLAVFVTTDRSADNPPAPIEGFWHEAAAYSGLELVRYSLFADMRHSGHRQRRSWLADVTEWARQQADARNAGARDG